MQHGKQSDCQRKSFITGTDQCFRRTGSNQYVRGSLVTLVVVVMLKEILQHTEWSVCQNKCCSIGSGQYVKEVLQHTEWSVHQECCSTGSGQFVRGIVLVQVVVNMFKELFLVQVVVNSSRKSCSTGCQYFKEVLQHTNCSVC